MNGPNNPLPLALFNIILDYHESLPELEQPENDVENHLKEFEITQERNKDLYMLHCHMLTLALKDDEKNKQTIKEEQDCCSSSSSSYVNSVEPMQAYQVASEDLKSNDSMNIEVSSNPANVSPENNNALSVIASSKSEPKIAVRAQKRNIEQLPEDDSSSQASSSSNIKKSRYQA